jgi:organic radical activating enzyme
MCTPKASSIIQEKYKKWNLEVDRRKNWTNNPAAWENILKSIDQIPIHRLHLMGGEPLLNKGFHKIIDHLIETNRNEISLSFATNGTLLTEDLLDKLRKFKNVDIEISLESISENNSYIRQGKDSDKVLDVVKNIIKYQDEKIQLILRSTLQLLNVNNYDQHILWAWENNVCVDSLYVITPKYLAINVLPKTIRKTLIPKYMRVIELIEQNSQLSFKTLVNKRNINNLNLQLIDEAQSVIELLNSDEPENIKELQEELSMWLMRWDREFKLNAYDYYPEYTEFLKSIGYEV